MSTTITKDGITWTIDGTPATGTFIGGDPYVVGTINISAISPQTTTLTGGRKVHGSMLNIQHRPLYDPNGDPPYYANDFAQGLDSRPPSSTAYDDDLNVANDLPTLAMVAGDSLISCESDLAAPTADYTQVLRAAVLTCVTAAPGPNEFRPPYWNEARPSAPYVWNDGMLDRLPKVFAASWGAGIADMATRARKLWSGIGHGEGIYRLRPKLNMEPYYVDLNKDLSRMMLALCSNIPNAQKRDLAIALCQTGIDYAWAAKNGSYQAGTHATGMKPIIVLMSMLLGHPDFDDVNALARTDLSVAYYQGGLTQDHRVVWGEDGQCFYVEETSSGVYNWGEGGYTAADVGNADWGNTHWVKHGESDVADWHYHYDGWDPKSYNNGYRQCCAASGWVGTYLSMLAMGAVKMWNHNPYFDWVRRWIDAAPALGLSLQGLDADIQALWEPYKPQVMASMRQIGIANGSQPRITMDTVADNIRPWRLRVNVGVQLQVVGVLVRSEETALRPNPGYFGARTQGLVYLDQATYNGSLLFTTDANGVAVIDMQAIDDVGETYTVQAGILMGGQIVTTNALEITVTAAT
jgi:hypothetical protein